MMVSKQKKIPAVKPKGVTKTKTSGVKTSNKTTQGKNWTEDGDMGLQRKKNKNQIQDKKNKDGKPGKPRPPPRPDPGYSLYSTDSEDQVTSTYREVELCEKILMQLKGIKGKKSASKDIMGQQSLSSRPLTSGTIDTALKAYNPVSQGSFLHQLSADLGNTSAAPAFNTRLTSSTPDPDKLPTDPACTSLLSDRDSRLQDIPERDIVIPTAEMFPSKGGLQASTNDQSAFRREIISGNTYKNVPVVNPINPELQLRFSDPQNDQRLQEIFGQRSDIQTGGRSLELSPLKEMTNSLGFSLLKNSALQKNFDPEMEPMRTDSALDTFEPYLARDSLGFYPPQGWLTTPGKTLQSAGQTTKLTGQMHPPVGQVPPVGQGGPDPNAIRLPIAQQVIPEVSEGPTSSRSAVSNISSDPPNTSKGENSTPNSSGTEYVMLPKPQGEDHLMIPGISTQGNHILIPMSALKVIFQKEQGLFQIHPSKGKTDSRDNSSGSAKSPTLSEIPVRGPISPWYQDQSDSQSLQISPVRSESPTPRQIWEVPERDVPHMPSAQKTSTVSNSSVNSSSTKQSNTFTLNSESTVQNLSATSAGTVSSKGKENVSSASLTRTAANNSGDFIVQNQVAMVTDGSQFPGQPCVSGTQEIFPRNEITTHINVPSVPFQQGQVTQPQGPITPVAHQVATNYASSCDAEVKRLRYLLKELKECSKVTKDIEVSRLVKEVDGAINRIPQLSATFSLQTEMDLALQPLRSENSQLRRRLRLTNQQLKEKEMKEKEGPPDINLEFLHLQTSNDTLQKVLKDEKEFKVKLANEVKNLHADIQKMKIEKSKLLTLMSEKDTEQLKLRQESLKENQLLLQENDSLKKEREKVYPHIDALEKENHILQVTLQQRDTEISRLQSVVQTMKEGISELIGDLDQTSQGADKSLNPNGSFGLHKLLRIVENEDMSSTMASPMHRKAVPTQKKIQTSPEKRKLRFNLSEDSTNLSPRLTQEALVEHDKYHTSRKQLFGGSASDSEVMDNTLLEMTGNMRNSRPCEQQDGPFTRGRRPSAQEEKKHRRTSSSSPPRLKYREDHSTRHKRSKSTPNYVIDLYEDFDDDKSESLVPVKGVEKYSRTSGHLEGVFDRSSTPHKKGQGQLMRLGEKSIELSEINSDITKSGFDQSRYSVTDYFNKYPRGRDQTKESSLNYRTTSSIEAEHHSRPRFKPPLRHPPMSKITVPSGGEMKSRVAWKAEDRRPLTSLGFRNRRMLENSVSMVDDDNISSVSEQTTSSVSTVDETVFRTGLATLDTNIARLQMALQKTKEMLS